MPSRANTFGLSDAPYQLRFHPPLTTLAYFYRKLRPRLPSIDVGGQQATFCGD